MHWPHRRAIKRLCFGVYFNTFRVCITGEMKNIPLCFIICVIFRLRSTCLNECLLCCLTYIQ